MYLIDLWKIDQLWLKRLDIDLQKKRTKKTNQRENSRSKLNFYVFSGHPLQEFLELYKNHRVLWNMKLPCIVRHRLGGFQLLDLITLELKSHMTC